MRFVFVLALVVACDEHGQRPDGFFPDASDLPLDAFETSCEFKGRTMPPGVTWKDECNTCMCRGGIAQCTLLGCPPTNGDESNSCTPSGTCPDGPRCGTSCCGPAEHCNGWACVCGDNDEVCGPSAFCVDMGACESVCAIPL